MTFILHRGAEEVPYHMLNELPMPVATASHCPIAHKDVVDMVKYSLGYYGHEVIEEHHAITENGDRYFGVLSLRSQYGDYSDTVGLRNSHDKTFPIGIAIGAKVFVCDNLSFIGDHVIKRRHTPKAKRDLPGLVAEVIEPLVAYRARQHERMLCYQGTEMPDQLADHAIMRMYRENVINVTRIADVVREWNEPTHNWGDKTAWRLFNAATFALTGRVIEKPDTTGHLHKIVDEVIDGTYTVH